MLLVAACCTLASVLAVAAAVHRILSRDHRLRAELLVLRTDQAVGSAAWLQAEAAEVCPGEAAPAAAQLRRDRATSKFSIPI